VVELSLPGHAPTILDRRRHGRRAVLDDLGRAWAVRRGRIGEAAIVAAQGSAGLGLAGIDLRRQLVHASYRARVRRPPRLEPRSGRARNGATDGRGLRHQLGRRRVCQLFFRRRMVCRGVLVADVPLQLFQPAAGDHVGAASVLFRHRRERGGRVRKRSGTRSRRRSCGRAPVGMAAGLGHRLFRSHTLIGRRRRRGCRRRS
jgi:hypothetical protein